MNPTCNKIKIVHVITRFDKGGSAENTFLTVCGLDKDRYDVVLVTGASHPRNAEDPEAEAIQANVTAARANQVKLINLRHLVRDFKPCSDIVAFFSLLNILWREKPLIVHTHTSKAGILGRWAAFLCRVPIIVHTPHGHVFWGYFSHWQTRLFIFLERWTARITTAIVSLTPQEKEDHLHFGIALEKKFRIIHSGVDIGRYMRPVADVKEIRQSLNLPERSFIVGTVGRLTAIKGHIHLLKAAVGLLTALPGVIFLFAGEGELHEDLSKFAADNGIAENVRFLGWRADVAALLSIVDVFVFPSLNEGMGKAVVEAMAMGKPVVASNVGGIPDLIIPGENGLLVPPADGTALAEAIMALYANPEKRKEMGEKGRGKALAYSSETMLNKINGLYESFIGR
jgi:glycosyltransferase involved in cell wall biosynthesis